MEYKDPGRYIYSYHIPTIFLGFPVWVPNKVPLLLLSQPRSSVSPVEAPEVSDAAWHFAV